MPSTSYLRAAMYPCVHFQDSYFVSQVPNSLINKKLVCCSLPRSSGGRSKTHLSRTPSPLGGRKVSVAHHHNPPQFFISHFTTLLDTFSKVQPSITYFSWSECWLDGWTLIKKLELAKAKAGITCGSWAPWIHESQGAQWDPLAL